MATILAGGDDGADVVLVGGPVRATIQERRLEKSDQAETPLSPAKMFERGVVTPERYLCQQKIYEIDGYHSSWSEDEIRYWTKPFGVTREELERAVERVGNSPASIRKELRNLAPETSITVRPSAKQPWQPPLNDQYSPIFLARVLRIPKRPDLLNFRAARERLTPRKFVLNFLDPNSLSCATTMQRKLQPRSASC
jgi:hypothetical protein